jgi:hypothetical protein
MIFSIDFYGEVMSKRGTARRGQPLQVKNAAPQNHDKLDLRKRVLEVESAHNSVR